MQRPRLSLADGPVGLTGGGTITSTNIAANRIVGSAGGSLVNVDNTIEGTFTLGANTMGIDNQGTIRATNTGITIDASAAGFSNSGTLAVANGSNLYAANMPQTRRVSSPTLAPTR